MTKHHHLLQLAAHHGLVCEAQDPVLGYCFATATWIDRNGYVLCEACADDSLVEVAALTAGAIRALGDGLPFDVQDYFRRGQVEEVDDSTRMPLSLVRSTEFPRP